MPCISSTGTRRCIERCGRRRRSACGVEPHRTFATGLMCGGQESNLISRVATSPPHVCRRTSTAPTACRNSDVIFIPLSDKAAVGGCQQEEFSGNMNVTQIRIEKRTNYNIFSKYLLTILRMLSGVFPPPMSTAIFVQLHRLKKRKYIARHKIKSVSSASIFLRSKRSSISFVVIRFLPVQLNRRFPENGDCLSNWTNAIRKSIAISTLPFDSGFCICKSQIQPCGFLYAFALNFVGSMTPVIRTYRSDIITITHIIFFFEVQFCLPKMLATPYQELL